MPRQNRKISKTGIYHIVCRGIGQQRLFEEVSDYEMFLQVLSSVIEKTGFIVYAYCLMDNHVHMLVEQGSEPLGATMKRVLVRYAQWFNRKYLRSGHLFQDRYKSEAIEDDAYLSTVLNYIYQNPLRAGVCKKSDSYRWSSRRLLGKPSPIVNETRFKELFDINDILEGEDGLAELNATRKKSGRASRYDDGTVAALIMELSGAGNTTEFQALSAEAQIKCIRQLRKTGVSSRQLARVAGVPRGRIIRVWGSMS